MCAPSFAAAPCPSSRRDIGALSQGLGLQLKGSGRRTPPALFAACCDLKEKENVGPKQKVQLYQLVWTELAASMRKGAVPTHRARKVSPGKCPVGLLGKKQPLPVIWNTPVGVCSPWEAQLIPAAVRNAALLSWEQDKASHAELTRTAEIKAVFHGCSVNELCRELIPQIFHVLHQSVSEWKAGKQKLV